jgi:hypothetical protein
MRQSDYAIYVFCASVLLATVADAQTPPLRAPTISADDTTAWDSVTAPIQLRGFGDFDFAATSDKRSDDVMSPDGFTMGNLVGDVGGMLGDRFRFFTEMVVTRQEQTAQFSIDVPRAYFRYIQNDRFQISVGQLGIPLAYWSTAFPFGRWAQTTIFRPDLVKDEWFQPDRFMGIVAEGTLVRRAGIGYMAGFGNGRERTLQGLGLDAASASGDATDVGHHRAEAIRVFVRPPRLRGVEAGGGVYHDTLAIRYTAGVPEVVTSVYVAVRRPIPEVIAEFSDLRHNYNGYISDTQAFYVQVATRMSPRGRWKPYARYEKAAAPRDEPVTGDLSNWKTTVGVRLDVTSLATLKIEYGHRGRPNVSDGRDGVFVQAAFVF